MKKNPEPGHIPREMLCELANPFSKRSTLPTHLKRCKSCRERLNFLTGLGKLVFAMVDGECVNSEDISPRDWVKFLGGNANEKLRKRMGEHLKRCGYCRRLLRTFDKVTPKPDKQERRCQ